MIRVLVLIDYSTEFSRRFLDGLIQYAQDAGEWSFYRLPIYYKSMYGEEGVIEWAQKWNASVIIAQWNYMSLESLNKLQIPVFLQNYKEESKLFSNITGDYVAMGVMAANFFIRRQFKNFAFYGNKGYIWSIERAEGFRNEIEKINGNYFYFESEDLDGRLWGNTHVQLEDWLISLPKPIAIFACDDSFAIQISEISKLNNINIPKEIALLGVDNDQLICNLSDPPISSIKLDAEKGGYELGQKIQYAIKRQDFKPFNITINPLEIELRKSTENYNIKDKNILHIIKYIQENYNLPLKIEKLTTLVPLSRRGLEVKFKNEIGISIYQFILNLRIEHFTTLLVTTNLSIEEITIKSGFNDYSNTYRLFKKVTGFSPTEYRKLHV